MSETAVTMEEDRLQPLRRGRESRTAPDHRAAQGLPALSKRHLGRRCSFPWSCCWPFFLAWACSNSWDLTPPGPLWGLRALGVLDGLVVDQVPATAEIKPARESAALRAVSFQPPLYAWLAALGMGFSADRNPLASVLPSYVAGVIVVILVYLHGTNWRGGGMGLAAAILLGFNPILLLRMQEVMPTTLALAGAVGALLCYGRYQRRQ